MRRAVAPLYAPSAAALVRSLQWGELILSAQEPGTAPEVGLPHLQGVVAVSRRELLLPALRHGGSRVPPVLLFGSVAVASNSVEQLKPASCNSNC